MPYTFEDTLQGERRNAITVPSATSDVLREQFAISYEENPIMALRRFSALAEDQVTGPRLPAETARARLKDAGMENDITITPGGISEAALSTLMERKRVERRRQEILGRSKGGVAEGAGRLGVGFATSLTDPISAGLNFIPVAGQARYARWLNAARSLGGRVAVRAAVGAAEGTVGAAIAELPVYAMRTQEQADYDMTDSLLNVAFGGVIGAGLHTTVGSAAELISRRLPVHERRVTAPRVEPVIGEAPIRATEPLPADIQRTIFEPTDRMVESLPPMARQAALREAVAQAVEGRPIDIESLVSSGMPAAPEVPRVPLTGLATDQINRSRDLADQLGVTADIERLAYEGRTAAEIATSLGPRLNRVRELATLNGESPVSAAGQFVREARTSIGVPSLDDRAEYQAWRQQYEARRTTQPPPDVSGVGRRSSVSRPAARGPVGESATDTDFRSATEHAEAVLAREIEPTTEASLKAAEEEASLAMADVTELAKRLDVDVKSDPDLVAVLEGVEKAERWARVAELATVCLVRGG